MKHHIKERIELITSGVDKPGRSAAKAFMGAKQSFVSCGIDAEGGQTTTEKQSEPFDVEMLEINADVFNLTDFETGQKSNHKDINNTNLLKNVLVVGGGATGLEAARVAAMRGHRVTLIEKSNRLGGSMYKDSLPPYKEKILEYIKWYENQLIELQVMIMLSTPYTDRVAQSCRPDCILVAAGDSYARFIPGGDGPNVLTAAEALNQPERVGKKVIVIGGGMSGCEVAKYFSAQEIESDVKHMENYYDGSLYAVKERYDAVDKEITVLEMLPEICAGIESFRRDKLLESLKNNQVRIMTKTKALDICDGKVRVIETRRGHLIELNADTVILASGLMPHKIDVNYLDADVIYLGDAVCPEKIMEATLTILSCGIANIRKALY